MKSDDFLGHIGSVKDKYIEEMMTESIRTARRHRDSRRTIASVAASIAIILLGGSLMLSQDVKVGSGEMTLSSAMTNLTMAQNSVIMLDVNPSIKVEVNDRSVVVNVEGLNDDSKTVLEGLELVGKEYPAAVSEIVSSMQQHEYITELKNSVLISVASQDDAVAADILRGAVQAVQDVDAAVDYGMSILTQTVTLDDAAAQLASQYGFSEGRADLISRFVSEHEDYSFDKLAQNNIQLLNQLFEYVGLPEGVERIGDVAGAVPSECEEKLDLDELSCDELVSFASAIGDFYDKLSEYYSPADVAQQIGYEFSIIESSTDDGQKLWAVLAESLTQNISNHGAIINIGQSTVSDWLNQSEIGSFIQKLTAAITAAA